MNEFKRQVYLEDSFESMHKLKPEVHYQRVDRNNYKIKLKHGKKEVILSEKMKDGLTAEATLEYNGEVTAFRSYYDAELAATAILKG